jgi:hypothetical protein
VSPGETKENDPAAKRRQIHRVTEIWKGKDGFQGALTRDATPTWEERFDHGACVQPRKPLEINLVENMAP